MNTTKKKFISIFIRIIAFVAIFSVLFYLVQWVIHYRWNKPDDLYSANVYYANSPDDSIDILFFGTSEIFKGVIPIVMYDEEGITGYNMSIINKSAVTTYYQLQYALRYQTPDIVLCDFSALYYDSLPSDEENIYRKVVAAIPDRDIRMQLIDEVCKLDPNQNKLDWIFPLFRCHSMVFDLDYWNFVDDQRYHSYYEKFKKGGSPDCSTYEGEVFDITPELWAFDESQVETSEISIKYYDMFIEECQSKGIKVVALIPPKLNEASTYAARWNTMQTYFDSRDVDYLNYDTYDEVQRIGLVLEEDYIDSAHLNINGAIKFSRILANDLMDRYELSDYRGDTLYKEDWDDQYPLFLDWKANTENVSE